MKTLNKARQHAPFGRRTRLQRARCWRRYVSVTRTAIAVISVFLVYAAAAIEIKPYPVAEISEAQWHAYHDAVNLELGASRRTYEKERLEVFSDEKSRANIAFTMPGHPAHPAWVTRYVGFENDELLISAIGYFAGSEDEFKVLFGQYMELVEEARRKFSR